MLQQIQIEDLHGIDHATNNRNAVALKNTAYAMGCFGV